MTEREGLGLRDHPLGDHLETLPLGAQARYALQAIQAIRRRKLVSMDVLEPAQRAFSERVQAKLRHSVWSSGCQSWYMAADGHNATTWPYFTFQYWWETRRFALSDYECVAEASADEPLTSVVPATAG